jgi:hypothetical protein
LGESLVPALEDIGELLDLFSDFGGVLEKIPGAAWLRNHFGYFPSIQLAKDVFNGLGDAIGFVGGLFSDEAPKVEVFAEAMTDARGDADMMKEVIKEARLRAVIPFKESVKDVTEALVNADTAWKNLTDSLDQEVALDNAKTKLAELETAAKLAFGSGAQADIDAYEQQAAEFVGMLSAISGAIDGISSKEILIRYKTQGPAAALELAGYLARGAEYGGLSQQDALTLAGISTLPRRAMGGPVAPGGGPYLVGERGPELFMPSASGNITPNHAMGGGANITVNVNGGDPDAVVRAIQKYARQNGAIPLQTTTGARF